MDLPFVDADSVRLDNLERFVDRMDIDVKEWITFSAIYQMISRIREKELLRHGLSAQQAIVLVYISLLEYQVTPSLLARYLQKQRNTVCEILARMESKGLIYRYTTPDNQKERPVQITEEARELIRVSVDTQSVRDVFSILSEKEHRQFMTLMNKLMESTLKVGLDRGINGNGISDRHRIIMDSLDL